MSRRVYTSHGSALSYEIPHLLEMPRVEKSTSMKKSSKVHTKYGLVPHVDTHVKVKL